MTAGALGLTLKFGLCQETIIIDSLVAGYWFLGQHDMNQKSHALLRNFPVLGNLRFIFEMFRPELRQYLIESDDDGKPFDRHHRSMVYQRSKEVTDTVPFGTRRDVYAHGYEFARHSLYPAKVDASRSRIMIGGASCKRPYAAALLNVSGMSYGKSLLIYI